MIISLPLQGNEHNNAENHFKNAFHAYQQQDYSNARTLFQIILRHDPQCIPAQRYSDRCSFFLKENLPGTTPYHINTALNTAVYSAELMRIGYQYFLAGKFNDAKSAYINAQRLGIHTRQALFGLFEISLAENNNRCAQEYIVPLITDTTAYWYELHCAANYSLMNEDTEIAEDLFARALQLRDDDASLLSDYAYFLLTVHTATKETIAVVKTLSYKALQYTTNYIPALYVLAEAYSSEKNYHTAITLYRQITALNPATTRERAYVYYAHMMDIILTDRIVHFDLINIPLYENNNNLTERYREILENPIDTEALLFLPEWIVPLNNDLKTVFDSYTSGVINNENLFAHRWEIIKKYVLE